MNTAATLERQSRSQASAERSDSTIHIRAPKHTKELIDSAASVEGKSRTDFILDSARKHAIDVLLDQRLFVLDSSRYDAFMAVLDNPPPAREKLKALMRKRPLWQK
jgi:uncharacterized protein (DUF1778 family)